MTPDKLEIKSSKNLDNFYLHGATIYTTIKDSTTNLWGVQLDGSAKSENPK